MSITINQEDLEMAHSLVKEHMDLFLDKKNDITEIRSGGLIILPNWDDDGKYVDTVTVAKILLEVRPS